MEWPSTGQVEREVVRSLRARCRQSRAWLLHEVQFLLDGRTQCRADLMAVAPDHVHIVEIKGPRDSLTKLPRQLRDYGRAAIRLDVALTGRHLAAAQRLLDEDEFAHVGLILVRWTPRLKLEAARLRPHRGHERAGGEVRSMLWETEIQRWKRRGQWRPPPLRHEEAAALVNDAFWAPVRQHQNNCLPAQSSRATERDRLAWLANNGALANMGFRGRRRLDWSDDERMGCAAANEEYWRWRRRFDRRYLAERRRRLGDMYGLQYDYPLFTVVPPEWRDVRRMPIPREWDPSYGLSEARSEHWEAYKRSCWWRDPEFMQGRGGPRGIGWHG